MKCIIDETSPFSSSGLLGAHVMADVLKQRGERMQWYRDELLHMAKELGYRLLPAFNTTSGLPYPRVTPPLLTDTSLILSVLLLAAE